MNSDDDTHIYVQYNEVILGTTSEYDWKPKKRMITKTFIFEIVLLLIFPIPYHDWYITFDAKET